LPGSTVVAVRSADALFRARSRDAVPRGPPSTDHHWRRPHRPHARAVPARAVPARASRPRDRRSRRSDENPAVAVAVHRRCRTPGRGRGRPAMARAPRLLRGGIPGGVQASGRRSPRTPTGSRGTAATPPRPPRRDGWPWPAGGTRGGPRRGTPPARGRGSAMDRGFRSSAEGCNAADDRAEGDRAFGQTGLGRRPGLSGTQTSSPSGARSKSGIASAPTRPWGSRTTGRWYRASTRSAWASRTPACPRTSTVAAHVPRS